ncbi:AAA family ATPase [Anaerosporobacter faecicola]|uniref:AAA family ATPase n=1 Tax=Anaerosporobacter faecicola TaxID=2718714 RepID=UPI0014395D6E|nr:AAA family ATPase [Anaerosporobacter faecicola]
MNILFVDMDEEYIIHLVMKFVEVLGDAVDIEIITDMDYMNQYLEKPHEIKILVISENLYDMRFERMAIRDYFLLIEQNRSEESYLAKRIFIYKYSSIGQIYTKIASMTGLDKLNTGDSHKGKLIMLYSPIGGCGKTYLSTETARALAALNKRVLYINVESVQDFGYYVQDQSYAGKEFELAMIQQSESLIEKFRNVVREDDFDYLPPFEQSTIALNITFHSYKKLLEKVRQLEIYDYILVELSSEFLLDNVVYMGMADQVLIITNQDALSVYKLERFLTNIDYTKKDKFKIICNAYQKGKENYLVNHWREKKYDVLEYIPKEEDAGDWSKTRNVYMDSGLQKIAYYLI